MEIRGYDTGEELLRTGSFIVFRGHRQRDRWPVLLKMPTREGSGVLDVAAFEREYDLLRRITARGIARTHELVRGPGVCLVFEDRGLVPLRDLVPAGLGLFFQIALRLTDALSELHRHDILYGIVTPDGVLADRSTGEVQLLEYMGKAAALAFIAHHVHAGERRAS